MSAVAKALLAAADDPRQVRYVSSPQAGFEVPQDVFERFEESYSPDGATEAAAEPAPKRRGRPRRNQISQEE